MGFLTGDQRIADQLAKTIRDVERLQAMIASGRGRAPMSTQSVWVIATGSPTDDLYDGTFQVWEADTAAFIDADPVEECKVRSSTPGGTVTTDVPLLGRIVDATDDDVPIVAIAPTGSAGTSLGLDAQSAAHATGIGWRQTFAAYGAQAFTFGPYLIPSGELIIPANSGDVWVTAGLTVVHGPIVGTHSGGAGGNIKNLVAKVSAIIAVISGSASTPGSKQFAMGQLHFAQTASGSSTAILQGFGNFVFDTSTGLPSLTASTASMFHGELNIAFLVPNSGSAIKLAWSVTLDVADPTGSNLSADYQILVAPSLLGKQFIADMPVTVITTTNDITTLTASGTETPDNGTHAHNHAVAFTVTPAGGSGSYTYAWDFGDGATSTSQNPSHTYTVAGNVQPAVTVTDTSSPPQVVVLRLNQITVT